MKSLLRIIPVFVITFASMADQSSRFGEIEHGYVHDIQNAKASPIAKAEIEWVIRVMQDCSWQMHQARLEVKQYVMSFFDAQQALVASAQLAGDGLYLSAGQGVFVCELNEQVADRIRQMQ